MDPTGGGFSKNPLKDDNMYMMGRVYLKKGGLGRSKQHTSFDSDEDSQQALQSGYGFRGYPQQQPLLLLQLPQRRHQQRQLLLMRWRLEEHHLHTEVMAMDILCLFRHLRRL